MKKDEIFKTLYLIVAITITILFFGIYQKSESAINRFQISTKSDGPPTMIDSKTGQVYRMDYDQWTTFVDGKEVSFDFDKIPK